MPPADPGGAASLPALIGRHLDQRAHQDDGDVTRLVDAIEDRHPGSVAAVLLYGSYLRGKRDTLLDFYVLLERLAPPALPGRLQALGNRLLPPNVYYLSLPAEAGRPSVRAKYATMTLDQFEQGMQRFQSYFWSRFTQPAGLVRARDEDARGRVIAALADAVRAFIGRVAPALPDRFAAPAPWRSGFDRTYRCELRAEQAAAGADLYDQQAPFFDAVLAAYASEPNSMLRADGDGYRRAVPHRDGALSWRLRAVQGKSLSVLRLVKAAGTFDDPLDYVLWKIERHSGIYIAPTDLQRRHPLIFAWPLLWRLYRRGAFR